MSVYQIVTDRIIAALESGIIPWNKPFTGDRLAIRRTNGQPYSLINQLLLGQGGEYLTFKQCKDAGGSIKKGAKSKIVVFWKMNRTERKDAKGAVVYDHDGNPLFDTVPLLRYYNVFHISDCEGIQPKYAKPLLNIANPVEEADGIIADYAARANLTIEHVQQGRAYYTPGQHQVTLPLMAQFKSTAGYYSTAFHELVHSTGHETLLNRFKKNDVAAAFGGESYSKEELVAEIGAASIMNEIGMGTEDSFRNTAAYVQSWIAALQNDSRLIISAASKAEKAVNLILNRQQEEATEAA